MDQTPGVGGIDPHKNTATVAVIDSCGGRRGCRSFSIDQAGIEELLSFLVDSELIIDRVGVEGSAFLGRPLVLALAAAGYDTREVQANRTAERRSRRRRAKTDNEDAEAIARETLAHPDLPPAGKRSTPDAVWEALGAIPPASRWPSSSSSPHGRAGERSTHHTSSPSCAPRTDSPLRRPRLGTVVRPGHVPPSVRLRTAPCSDSAAPPTAVTP